MATRVPALMEMSVNPSHVDHLAPRLGSTGLYAFVVEHSDAGSAHIAARHFPAGIGIIEDPATGGSAAAPALWLRRVGHLDGLTRLAISQGDDMGRPCRLTVTGSDDDATGWRVGGRVVLESPPGPHTRVVRPRALT
ncbi:PhzF family phenazine biosynthesis protein [Cystobacter ferrugineus]|uniref:Uncharacterized protein n=1 Tax=Cystobacter ferrugineus TaxID=83449 RepID=A0A1L9AZ68_9BACT|nr:PhzF family phenazine biosynthesis protein [Cystobacter ferrugineus]OJH35318.1 hypothetical protein BON30_37850 [Cystobacter ferrugineus]